MKLQKAFSTLQKKKNEHTNLFLIERICQKLISFQSRIKKKKFKSFRDAVERMEASSCGKTKSTKVNKYILGALTSFSVQSGSH